jgi:GTP cyclohydrolase IA
MADVDRARIERAVRELIVAIGEDPSRPGLERTPERVAETYSEFFAGLGQDPLVHLADTVALGATASGVPGTADTVILRDIAFRSVCEHHLLPFVGVAHVAYLPHERVIGLGRIPAVIETLAARPQLQERLAEEIADTLQQGLEPRGVLVVLDAVHRCVTARGSRQASSSTVTVVSRGELGDPTARAEAMALIGSADGG